MRRRATAAALATTLTAALASGLAGCGQAAHSRRTGAGRIPAALLAEMRPIGRGPRFQPPARGPVIGTCGTELGPRFGVHVEVFAANRVVIIPAGIGTAPPRRVEPDGLLHARCYGALVTLQPTGVVLVRRRMRATLAQLFRSWGQALSATRLASFGADHVRAYVGGRRTGQRAGTIALARHAEIVVEIGPYVPPHRSFTFPPGM